MKALKRGFIVLSLAAGFILVSAQNCNTPAPPAPVPGNDQKCTTAGGTPGPRLARDGTQPFQAECTGGNDPIGFSPYSVEGPSAKSVQSCKCKDESKCWNGSTCVARYVAPPTATCTDSASQASQAACDAAGSPGAPCLFAQYGTPLKGICVAEQEFCKGYSSIGEDDKKMAVCEKAGCEVVGPDCAPKMECLLATEGEAGVVCGDHADAAASDCEQPADDFTTLVQVFCDQNDAGTLCVAKSAETLASEDGTKGLEACDQQNTKAACDAAKLVKHCAWKRPTEP